MDFWKTKLTKLSGKLMGQKVKPGRTLGEAAIA